MKLFFHPLYFLLLIFLYLKVNAQQDSVVKLPFAIADEKKLSEDDLKNKKEGIYLTGVPDLSSDPVNGFGYGGEGELYFNGKRSDPFFAYTAYRYKLGITLFNTTKNQREFAVALDAPYIFNTKWRFRFGTVYEKNPNRLYFGYNAQTLNALSSPDNQGLIFSHYQNYLSSLQNIRKGKPGEASEVTDFFYNNFTQEEVISNISMEHTYLQGRMRVLLGYEFGIVRITTFNNYTYHQATDSAGNKNITVPNGETKLDEDNKAGLVRGIGTNILGMAQAGIIYDTRDLEADPGKGIFAELTNEWSNKAVGSVFNFNKTFFHIKGYKNIIPSKYKTLVIAARGGFIINQGSLPFYENYDCWSTEGSIEALGGPRNLRGYKQWRFTGKFMDFYSVEARLKVYEHDILKQHFAFGLAPFFDAGSVSDKFPLLLDKNNFRYSEGLGIRIAWNINTILRFDYAVSKEDKQFFFKFGHTF